MQRGTEATWQSPGGPREAQMALTRGRRPRRRAHANARVGRHVQAGNRGDGDEINWGIHPPYLTATSPTFFSVWDYVPTRSYLAGDVDV